VESSLGRTALVSALVTLSACGGGGGDPAPAPVPPPPPAVNVNTVVSSSGGDDTTQVDNWEVTINGPDFTLASAANVQVCASGTWNQKMRIGSTIRLWTTALAPVQLPTRTGPIVDAFGVSIAALEYAQCDNQSLAAGTHSLSFRIRVEPYSGAAPVLSSYTANLRWQVRPAP
jgi:hypothetical protein